MGPKKKKTSIECNRHGDKPPTITTSRTCHSFQEPITGSPFLDFFLCHVNVIYSCSSQMYVFAEVNKKCLSL